MNEQRNLYLAIGISIAIIIFFQILLPTQPIQPPPLEENETLEPATSIDGQTNKIIKEIKSREEVINTTKRVSFKNSSSHLFVSFLVVGNQNFSRSPG